MSGEEHPRTREHVASCDACFSAAVARAAEDERERPWTAGIYGPARAEELPEVARGFWLEDVAAAERDAREALDRLAFALLASDRAAPEEEERRAALVGFAVDDLVFAARRMARTRTREQAPGPTYRATKEGLRHYARSTAATRRNGGSSERAPFEHATERLAEGLRSGPGSR